MIMELKNQRPGPKRDAKPVKKKQQHSTRHYNEPAESRPRPYIFLPSGRALYYSPIYA
jgi:hypothetical protein